VILLPGVFVMYYLYSRWRHTLVFAGCLHLMSSNFISYFDFGFLRHSFAKMYCIQMKLIESLLE